MLPNTQPTTSQILLWLGSAVDPGCSGVYVPIIAKIEVTGIWLAFDILFDLVGRNDDVKVHKSPFPPFFCEQRVQATLISLLIGNVRAQLDRLAVLVERDLPLTVEQGAARVGLGVPDGQCASDICET
jgi:hypothetical protein